MNIIDLKNTLEYKEYGFSIVKCPCCGEYTLDNYYVCPTCNWRYDRTYINDKYSEVNHSTLKDFKNKYLSTLNKTIIEHNENNNITYYINEGKRTVICKLTTQQEFINKLIVIPSCTYTGKAKCALEDYWNVDKGKRIALIRALQKYYKDKQKILAESCSVFTKFLSQTTKHKEIVDKKLASYKLEESDYLQ